MCQIVVKYNSTAECAAERLKRSKGTCKKKCKKLLTNKAEDAKINESPVERLANAGP